MKYIKTILFWIYMLWYLLLQSKDKLNIKAGLISFGLSFILSVVSYKSYDFIKNQKFINKVILFIALVFFILSYLFASLYIILEYFYD